MGIGGIERNCAIERLKALLIAFHLPLGIANPSQENGTGSIVLRMLKGLLKGSDCLLLALELAQDDTTQFPAFLRGRVLFYGAVYRNERVIWSFGLRQRPTELPPDRRLTARVFLGLSIDR